jgi:type IV secretory pathway TrbD component
MTLHRSRIHKIAFRKPLIWGCDRRGILLIAGISLLMLWTQTWVGLAYAVLVWPAGLFYLRKAGTYDPLLFYGLERMFRVYHPQTHFPPRSTPYRRNRGRRAKRYAQRQQKPLL